MTAVLTRSPRSAIAFAIRGGERRATADDALAAGTLARRMGGRIEPVPWDLPSTQWERYAAVIIRSTWDYHLRLEEFLSWADRAEAAGASLWNPARVLRWNAHKGYLREIAAAGVPIVPTEWLPAGSATDVRALLREREWDRGVVKPSVSATAFRTFLAEADDPAGYAGSVADVMNHGDALVQPFLSEVIDCGEWSFVYFGGAAGPLRFSHSVLKRPRAGDFRVQDQFGGTAKGVMAGSALLRQVARVAEVVTELAPGPLLYARFDGVVSRGDHAPSGTFLLMEAELIEPALFLGASDEAASRFAGAIAERVRGKRATELGGDGF